MPETRYPALQENPRFHYELISEIGKGTYGCVYEALDRRDGSRVAMKKVLPKAEREGFPITAIREIKTLKSVRHINVLELYDVVFDLPRRPTEKVSVYMVFPYLKHDLVGIQHYRRNRLYISEIKCITLQVLRGLHHLHSQNIVHRDLKLANLLIDGDGVVKIADFGLSRIQLPKGKDLTNKVVTRWYRSPELLLGATKYDFSVDMWSVGAILGELIAGAPLFPGESEVHVLRYIFDTLGSPSERLWSNLYSFVDSRNMLNSVAEARRQLTDFVEHPTGVCHYDSRPERPTFLLIDDRNRNYLERKVFKKLFVSVSLAGQLIIASLLQYDPARRPSAQNCLNDPFFHQDPLASDPKSIILSPESRRELHVKEGLPMGKGTKEIFTTSAKRRVDEIVPVSYSKKRRV